MTMEDTPPPATLNVLLGIRDARLYTQWLDGLDAIEDWCPALGPTSSLLMSRLVRGGERTWEREELAVMLGVTGMVVERSLRRLEYFRLVQRVDECTIVACVSSRGPKHTWASQR